MKVNKGRIIFLGSMILLVSTFYLFAMPITVYWYDLPNISLGSQLKYITIKILTILCDPEQITFPVDIPDEIFSYWQEAGWAGATKHIPAFGYPEFFEKLPNGWMYIASLYWLSASIVISLLMSFSISRNTTDLKQQTRIRGAALGTSQDLAKSLRKSTDGNNIGISIGNLHLPRSLETRHFMVLGTTGTGKSYLLMAMQQAFQQRAVKLVVIDRKGEFHAAFGNSEDKLFNPYDRRHCKWNLFNEFGLSRALDRIPERLRDMADSLFSVSANNHNAHFYNAAADVFCSSICYLALQGKTSTADIVTFFAAGGLQIVKALKTLPAGLACGLTHLGVDGNDEHSGSILSTLTERCKDFSAFIGQDGDFAIHSWMRSGKGNLYISTAGENDQRFKSITAMLLDIIGQEIKAMPECKTTCIAIVIDELASLPPLKTLNFLLNEGRSKGICVIIANQTLSKISDIYGEAGAKNIFANTNTTFIFRLPEPSDAKYISDAIGEQEVIRVVKSQNETTRGIFDLNGNSQGKSTSEQIVHETIIMPSQIQNLSQRHVIAMIPDAPVAELILPKMQLKQQQSMFEARQTDEITAKEIAAAISPPKNSNDDIDDFRF
ncbi:MAG: conjugative transfer protein TraD [Firmicutes bacterium]|nr:conjugative transfer protein TraD [Bacillota bacterium]